MSPQKLIFAKSTHVFFTMLLQNKILIPLKLMIEKKTLNNEIL